MRAQQLESASGAASAGGARLCERVYRCEAPALGFAWHPSQHSRMLLLLQGPRRGNTVDHDLALKDLCLLPPTPLAWSPADELLQELHDARGGTPSEGAGGSDKEPGIYVYGTTWCGFTRKQVAEVEDALQKDEQLESNMLHYIQCDKDGKDDPVCQSLQAFPLTMVHRGPPTPEQAGKHEPGKQPADHLLKQLHRKLEHPRHH